jgi:hypothetical protein
MQIYIHSSNGTRNHDPSVRAGVHISCLRPRVLLVICECVRESSFVVLILPKMYNGISGPPSCKAVAPARMRAVRLCPSTL